MSFFHCFIQNQKLNVCRKNIVWAISEEVQVLQAGFSLQRNANDWILYNFAESLQIGMPDDNLIWTARSVGSIFLIRLKLIMSFSNLCHLPKENYPVTPDVQGKVKMSITSCLATTFPELFCLSLGNVHALVGRVNVFQYFQFKRL